MKYVLITGAAGNIGSALVNKLLKDDKYFIIAIDNLSTGSRYKLPRSHKNLKFVKADVNDYTDISQAFIGNKFDYIFHFAAIVGVERTLKNPLKVLRDIDGIRNILMLSKNTGVKRIFYSSSSEVYGEPVSMPQHEDLTPLNSKLPYAIVKNLGEAYCKSYNQEHGLEYTIFRFFNTYGPNQSEDFVVPRFLKAAMNHQPISIYGDGQQTRTFCYVDDNIDTIVCCMENGYYINDVINIGSDQEINILELANKIIHLTDSESHVLHLPPLENGDMSRRRPDISKMKKIMDRDFITIDDGLVRLVNYYKSQNNE